MKRFIALAVLFPCVLFAGVLKHTISFLPDELRFSRFNGYDMVDLPRGTVVPDPGKPCLPLFTVTLAIPAEARLTGVDVEPVETMELPGSFTILPSQPARRISSQEPGQFVGPDPQIYSGSQPFPARPLIRFRTGNAGGFQLVAVTISPLQFLPSEHRLILHTRLTITVQFDDAGQQPTRLSPNQRDRLIASLQGLVANQKDLVRFAPPVGEPEQPQIDLLVITSPELAPELGPYLEYRTMRGLKTELRTTDWIDRNYPGRDLQEKTRNLIIDYFHHRGLTYVLLAGDNLQVPSRRIRLEIPEPWDIPTDLYYGDLDYTWDSNQNNLFGEMGDEVDLYADIFVGRISVDNPSQVQNFLAKLRTYEANPAPDYIKRSLLPSGWLWRELNYHGRIVNDSIANLTPSGWTDRKLENPASARIVADSFDHGFAIFDPAGHGNESGVYDQNGTPIYTSGYAHNQHNDRRFTIMTSLACNPGNFEAEDCLAEVSLNCVDGGSIAVIMNSRYGWGTPPYMGPSEKLCVRFYDFLFNHDQFVIGPCHDRSREEYVGYAQWDEIWRWCFVEFNLLGDPTLDIWTEPAQQFTLFCPDTIATGSQNLNLTLRQGSSPIENALVCAYKDCEVLATGRTNSSGQVQLRVHPVTTGTLLLTATGHNLLPAVETVTVIQGVPEPLIAYQRHHIDDTGQANPNGLLEPGETCQLTLVVRNSGTANATNATVTLHPLTQAIAVSDSQAFFGTIASGDSARTNDLTITASPAALPGSNPEILATVHADQGDWQLLFSIQLGYPGRVCAEIDTGLVALTITARGAIGFDNEASRQGRGFRYPKSDTTCLNIASLALGNSASYLVDRFYNTNGLDRDWQLVDSIRARSPIWNTDELLSARFSDAGHPQAKGLTVEERALGIGRTGYDNFIILVYDIWNFSSEPVNGLYAGILADFDVLASDRLHDMAYTLHELATAFMRNINPTPRFCGIKLLYPHVGAHLTSIDHGRYLYPDSGLSEDMKFRALQGTLGSPRSDRPYNWSVSVSTGPFDLPPDGGRQRVAFAFIATPDSISYITACQSCQTWFDANVGLSEATSPLKTTPRPTLQLLPNPFTSTVTIRYSLPVSGHVRISAVDATGRKV
ncbi:MAG: C25 family cysteine peptidase, partial [candidate division WOR-3 bacterium]